jgi:hypothetical protein
MVAEIVRVTCQERPANRFGVGKDTIAKVWSDHNLKPWKVETFKISNDPHFEEKLIDVVGLYMNPPSRAVVFSFDEKIQCQAMDRTQPSLPMVPSRAGTMTDDYKRNGTTDLFAAMNISTGEVLTHCQKGQPPRTSCDSSSRSTPASPEASLSVSYSTPLCAQGPGDHQVARTPRPPTLAPALHPNVEFLDQPHRAVVQRTDRPARLLPPRNLHQRERARRGHRTLGRRLERRPNPFIWKISAGRDHREGPTRTHRPHPRNSQDLWIGVSRDLLFTS